MKRVVFTLVLGLFVSIPVFSQSTQPVAPTDDEDVVKISTTLIQLDAVVTGKDGKQVTNLSADDFEVFENGKKQKISNFSYVTLNPASKQAAKVAANSDMAISFPSGNVRVSDVRRTIALVVDDLGLTFDAIPYVKDALRKFINTEVGPGDAVAVIRTGGGIGALQSFSSDKRQMLLAVDQIRWNAYGRSGISMFDPVSTSLKRDLSLVVGPGGNTQTVVGSVAQGELLGDITDERRQNFESGTLGALNYIVRGMSDLPGRKSVILFSDGFQAVSARQDRSIATHIFDSLKRLADIASRSSVVFYTFDPRGLQVSSLITADVGAGGNGFTNTSISRAGAIDAQDSALRDSQATLRFLAYQTGGFPLINKNDLSKGLERVMDDQKGYYLIAYEPDDETFDPNVRKYNQVKIQVKQDGLDIRTRNGFYSIPDEKLKGQPTSIGRQVYQALTSPFNSGEINLQVNSVFANDREQGDFLQSTVYIKGRDLKFCKAGRRNV